jgi:hypothetical protein
MQSAQVVRKVQQPDLETMAEQQRSLVQQAPLAEIKEREMKQ